MKSNEVVVKCKVLYESLLTPIASHNNDKKKYVATLAILKENPMWETIQAAVAEAYQNGLETIWNGVAPSFWHSPIGDGDGKRESNGRDYPSYYHGYNFIRVSSSEKYPPELVDADFNELEDKEVHAGMIGFAYITFFPYAVGVNKGVGASINSFMKTDDGEYLSVGRVSAREAFANIKK